MWKGDDFARFVEGKPYWRDAKTELTLTEMLAMTIADLELSIRSYNRLTGEGIQDVYQLTQMTENDLLRIPGLGRISLKEITKRLRGMGLELKTSLSMVPFGHIGKPWLEFCH